MLTIVVTYNGTYWIDDCLGSLQQSSVPLDITVVDNQSTDNTVTIIKERFAEVQLLESQRNLGFGRANNLGLKKALENDYDYAFLLNQDAWVERDTVETLIKIHQKNSEYGIITPVHLTREKTRLDSKFSSYLYQANNPALMSDLLLAHQDVQSVYRVGFVNAAAWFISKACLQTVGGFDPLFPHYGEDQDYVQRATYYQFAIGFTPHTHIVHDREGYVKSNDMHRSLARQYNYNLVLLKNVHRPFSTNLYIAFRNEIYYTAVALLSFDTSLFVVKIKLLWKLLTKISAIRRSWMYCRSHRGAYL